MWILKGTFLGLLLTASFTFVLLCFSLFGDLRPNTAIGISVLVGFTASNPTWWAGLLISLVAGCLVARSWPGKGWFWTSLAAALLLPAGILGIFLAGVAHLGYAR
jgi:hypothetical protein